MANKDIQWHHGISDDAFKMIGEVIVQWSAAESYVANSLNFLFQIRDEALRREASSWAFSKKLDFLAKVPPNHSQRELVDEIVGNGRKWIVERNCVAHSLAMVDIDGQPFLAGPKNKGRVDLSSLQVYLEHARRFSKLSLKLYMALAAPWTVETAWLAEEGNSSG